MSANKARALQRLQANEWLQSPTLVPAQKDPGDLSADQPSQPLAAAVIDAAVAALEGGDTHYADVPGITPLREAVATWLNQTTEEGGYTTDHVLITAGIQEARFLAIQVLGEFLGRIAVPEVVHPGARQALAVRAIEFVPLPVSDVLGLLPSLDAIRAVLEAGARLVFLESPSRLTGAIYSPVQVRELAAIIEAYDAAVIWDQGMAPWVAPEQYKSLADSQSGAQRVAVLGELWPGIGLESWQIGYSAAPPAWISQMQVQKQIISICTNTAVQHAALAVANTVVDDHRALQAGLSVVRQSIADALHKHTAEPIDGAAANVVALRPSDPAGALTRARNAGLTVADGALFGAAGLLRLSVTPNAASMGAVQHMFVKDQPGGGS